MMLAYFLFYNITDIGDFESIKIYLLRKLIELLI